MSDDGQQAAEERRDGVLSNVNLAAFVNLPVSFEGIWAGILLSLTFDRPISFPISQRLPGMQKFS